MKPSMLCNKELIATLARNFISDSVEVNKDIFDSMANDERADGSESPPNDNDFRTAAADYAADMLSDFRQEVLEAIQSCKFTANARVEHVLETNLEFHKE